MSKSDKFRITEIRREICVRDGNLYRYRLVMKEDRNTPCDRPPLFSIEAELTTKQDVTTVRQLQDAFIDPGKALAFFHLVLEHLVTPIDLPYVFEDAISS